MSSSWTFGRKVGAGFAVTVALAIAVAIVAVYALRSVVADKDRVIEVDGRMLIDAALLDGFRQRSTPVRYLLTGDDRFLKDMQEARDGVQAVFERLEQRASDDEVRTQLAGLERAEADYRAAVDRVVDFRRGNADPAAVSRAYDDQILPVRERLEVQMQAFTDGEERRLQEAMQTASDAASRAIALVVIIAVVSALFAGLVAFFLTRALSRQVGSAVGQVQSSSTELQAAASQQATGAKEQSTAMNEISTTISELMATSRQIAESAQRVADMAEQTAAAARSGDATVASGTDSMTGIRRQVDLIVSHMLELGKKSQQIGSVLDIVSELAEQTNILAINATIEAAGSGEAGKRFAVVADEIRKLADRVAGSTKEIRVLIDDIRSAVNTTVMTTETGSKAVDTGTKQFAAVAAAFNRIGGLVSTTTEAAKEIELSTKQQASAVEQVNVGITNVAQATKETETSTGQTLQTASQLTTLARELLRLVQAQEVVAAR